MAEELAPLTKGELDRLTVLEATVDSGLKSFIEVGNALIEIRDSGLYRDTHGTFEAYCDARYGFSRRRGYQLMQAAEVGTIVHIDNEAQARELGPLLDDPEQLRGALAEAAEGGKPTGAKIKEAVARRLPSKDKPKPELPASGKSSEGEQLVLDLNGAKRLRWKAEAERRGYSLPEFVDACVEAELAINGAAKPPSKDEPPVEPTMRSLIDQKPPSQTVTMPGGKVFRGPDPKVKGPTKAKGRR
jgi:hypothetical protein